MKALVKKAFPGRPDNEIKTREIKEGEVIEGDLASVAVAEGWAEEVQPSNDAMPQQPGKKIATATVEDVLAYLKGLDPAPTSKPKVGETSEILNKKVSGKIIDAAWVDLAGKE